MNTRYVIVNSANRERIDNRVFERYLAAEKHWHSFDNWEDLDIERGVLIEGKFVADESFVGAKEPRMETETSTDFSKLPDRELDALIAQRLFGWKWYAMKRVCGDRNLLALLPEYEALPEALPWVRLANHEEENSLDRFNDWDSELPRYSGKIDYSFKVVCTMRERGYWMRLEGGNLRYYAGFDKRPFLQAGSSWVLASNENPARAICEAALLVVT